MQEYAVCRICPKQCRLAKGVTGNCRARSNAGGEIVPLAWARPCAVAVDPMEKKPLYHFFPGENVLSLGMAGCNLHCRNCQNANISQESPLDIKGMTLLPDDLVSLMRAKHLRAVAYTYTEPLVAFEYVLACARRVKEYGGVNVLVSAAYVRAEPLAELLPFIDAANIDLKAMSDAFYRKNCKASLSPVLDALRLFRRFPVALEITNLVIPTLNDSDDLLRGLARFVHNELGAETPLHFSRFFPCHELAYLEPTPLVSLHRARDIARSEGLYHVYLGNTAEPEVTYCAGCGSSLVTRRGYTITANRLAKDGQCPVCHKSLYGRF